MTFKTQSPIDPNHHKGLLALNSITGEPLVVTGKSLINAQPLHVSMVDGYGSNINTFTSRNNVGSQTTTISGSTSETTIVPATSATYHDLTAIFISNTSGTGARVDIRDTTSGTVIFQFYVPPDDIRGVSLMTPWAQTTVNTNWTAQSSASVVDLRISVLFMNNK